jgi:hypothetical protein
MRLLGKVISSPFLTVKKMKITTPLLKANAVIHKMTFSFVRVFVTKVSFASLFLLFCTFVCST